MSGSIDDECDLCDKRATTSVTLFGDKGATRIPLCDECSAKAKHRDPATWEKIREILSGG